MAKSPGDSKIPVLHANPLKSRISKPLSTLSSRVRAHLDASKSRASASSVLFGILSATGGNLKNVTVGKSINVSHFNSCRHHTATATATIAGSAANHDDLNGNAPLAVRPTNLFTSGHHFPAVGGQPGLGHRPIAGVEHIGRRVRLNSGKEGVLRFVGETLFGEGVWCGVELDYEEGSTDGAVNNVRYFSCAKNYGLFVPASNVGLAAPTDEVREYVSDVSDSGPHSLLGITGDVVEQPQYDGGGDRPSAVSSSEIGCYFRGGQQRLSGGHLQPLSQTPTPNSSTGSFVASSCEWKCGSQHSSSAGSLALSQRGCASATAEASSIHVSKHSSFEHDESLGILTPDQMGELTAYSNDVTVLGGGSCDDFRSLAFHDTRNESLATSTCDAACRQYPPSAANNVGVEAPATSLDAADERAITMNATVVAAGNVECEPTDDADTCMMSASSSSDQHLEVSKEILRSSPSLEELPIDELDALSCTLVAVEQVEVSQPPAASAPPTSFVTSVTSIGSWDNGYQGDAEGSRPTSRGADASPLARAPKLVAKVLDPMTDSDFYTESDADLYEDVSSCFRGDRKARIIDGKLFGSPVNTKLIVCQSYGTQIFSAELQSQPLPLPERGAVAEEMDSSGVFSDLERRVEPADGSPLDYDGGPPEETHSDTSGQSSSKSVSSQKKIIVDSVRQPPDTVSEAAKIVADGAMPAKKVDDAKSSTTTKTKTTKVTVMKPECGLKRRNDALVRGKESSKSSESSSSSSVATKPKIARRVVTSKVKAMIAASNKNINRSNNDDDDDDEKCCDDENQENRRPVVSKSGSKKMIGSGGRCDTTAATYTKAENRGRNEAKPKSEKMKDAVKSKATCGSMPRMLPAKLHKDVKPFSSSGNVMNKALMPSKNAAALSGSTRSLKDTSSHRMKNRKIRNRTNQESSVQSVSVSCSKSLSQTSSRNSSVTDISDSHVDLSQHSLPAVVISAEYSRGKKSSSLLCSPVSESAVSTALLHTNSLSSKDVKISTLPRTRTCLKQQIGSVNSLVEDSSTTAMKVPKKMTYRRTLPKVVPLKDQNRVLNTNVAASSVSKTAPLKPLADHCGRTSSDPCKAIKTSKTKSLSQISKINPLLSRLKYATDGMEAFIILFQRLTTDPDVFVLPYLKEELSQYKKDWLDMKLKLEEANVSCRRMKEETEMQKLLHDQRLEELREIHMAQLDRLNESHSKELDEHSIKYEERLRDLENKLRHQEQILQTKFDDDLRRVQREAEQKLEAILEETKSQVELLKIENDVWKEKLIKESWRKLQDMEAKFKTKMETVEAGYIQQLNEADKEARKREELFLTSMQRKPAANRVDESNSEIGKFSLESTSLYGSRTEYQNLEEEICSLRTVLDLKHAEIQDLRKQNEKLRRETQDLPFVSQKLDSAQARVEDLNAQLQAKIENEKKLLKENRRLMETVQHENEKKKRLTFQNEELLWKLKRSAQVAKTLAVFNSGRTKEERVSESEALCVHSTPVSHRQYSHSTNRRHVDKCLKRSRTEDNIKLGSLESSSSSSTSDGSAATSPKVLGVVEKSDSVSWVLEIDESPMAVASRMLRRANSLRGVPSKKKSSREHQSLTLPTRAKKKCSTSTGVDDAAAAAVPSSHSPSDVDERTTTATAMMTSSGLDGNVAGDNYNDSLAALGSSKATSFDENAITDISSFFDFLHEADFVEEGDVDVRTAFYANIDDKTLPVSPFSNSSSTDSSLELDGYDRSDELRSYARLAWTNDGSSAEDVCNEQVDTASAAQPRLHLQQQSQCRQKTTVTDDSSGLSDLDDDDDESVDTFPSSNIDGSSNLVSEVVANVPSK